MGNYAVVQLIDFSLRNVSFLLLYFRPGSFGFQHMLKQLISPYLDFKQRITMQCDRFPVMGHCDT